jgi:beta-phosphoglucomutase family hydrolase
MDEIKPEPKSRADRDGKNPVARDRFDAVLFDLDGVLTSTAAIHAEAWKEMFDAFLQKAEGARFRPFDMEQDYKRYVDGKPRYEGVESFLAARGIALPPGKASDPASHDSVAGLGNQKDALVKRAIAEGRVEAFPSSVRWVKQLRADGFALAVVSSSKNCGPVLKAAGIAELFDLRVDGETLVELGLRGKPAPDSFLKAAELLRVAPTRAVVVEDALAGVEAGRAGAFGLVLGVDREGQADALLAHGADLVVRDLAELIRP